MMNRTRVTLMFASVLMVCGARSTPTSQAAACEDAAPRSLAFVMPRSGDYTHMWWADGFPGHHAAARWWRVIQTGYYAFVLDTQKLEIPHFGRLDSDLDYLQATRSQQSIWNQLPAAALTLTICVNGTRYQCVGGDEWTMFDGPRLIESGRFLQRADVTDLRFVAQDGTRLNVEARLETIGWSDRLSLLLVARPGRLPISTGEDCFGRLGGGFGLDGTNQLEITEAAPWNLEEFAVEFWAYVPVDCQVSERTHPWLMCMGANEHAEGHVGIALLGRTARATMNVGGGPDNLFVIDAPRQAALRPDAWHHLAVSYDGTTFRLYVNGVAAGERRIGRRRTSGDGGLVFGRRQDNFGDGYHFRGVVDEIRFYDRELTLKEIRQRLEDPGKFAATPRPIRTWSFRADGVAAEGPFRARWRDSSLKIQLKTGARTWQQTSEPVGDNGGNDERWQQVCLALDLGRNGEPQRSEDGEGVTVAARDLVRQAPLPTRFDADRFWCRVDLDSVEPVAPPGRGKADNDVMERVELVLANGDDVGRTVRLLFAKHGRGIRTGFGAPITGMSAVLRDMAGHPTGIPVQLSKNWHTRPEGGVYAGVWFHGFSQIRLPPRSEKKFELTLVYGHWGGVPAASHAQLCLIGWGSNQLWDQSAMGAWGESICYEPDQAQAECGILDVRPLMVRSMSHDGPWNWTHNVGGGDFFRVFDEHGVRLFPHGMRTAYQRQGPCLTEVVYAGRTGDALQHSAAVSIVRSDDIVRGTYRLRLDVNQSLDFSRLVIFQIGADTYSYTGERRMAVGDETGMLKAWATRWGGDTYRTKRASESALH